MAVEWIDITSINFENTTNKKGVTTAEVQYSPSLCIQIPEDTHILYSQNQAWTTSNHYVREMGWFLLS